MRKTLNQDGVTLEQRYEDALNDEDQKALIQLMVETHNEVQSEIVSLRQQNIDLQDENAMAQRGYPILTAQEKKYYMAAVEANTFGDGVAELFPTKTLERVFESIEEEFPILKAVGIVNTFRMTKFPVFVEGVDTAVWGNITDEIKGQLDFAINVVSTDSGKLTCYMVVPQDLFLPEVGIAMLDRYIVSYMTKAMGRGFEKGILTGTGYGGEIIGFNRDLEAAKTTVYIEKNPVALTDLKPSTLGPEVMLPLTQHNETGKILLVCNAQTYWGKIFGLVTFQLPDGSYKTNALPIPAEFVLSAYVPDDRLYAIRPDGYFLGVSHSTKIEKSDEYKFIEDWKTYKAKAIAGGTPVNNDQSVVFDVTNLAAPAVDVVP